MDSLQQWAHRVRENIGLVIYGKSDVIDRILIALLCRGHVLLEDVPGVGKTILARAIAASLGCTMQRVQCTPDLMPADVVGVTLYDQSSGEFVFRQGPVATNLLLVDEINRATPRTQSALLEAMEERVVTVDGVSHPLPKPFFVLATENPVEFDGTFPLPEAQKDRFFLATRMGYPDESSELDLMEAHRRVTHPVADLGPVTNAAEVLEAQHSVEQTPVRDDAVEFLLDLVAATRSDPRLRIGASPRASRALYRGAQALAALRGAPEATVQEVQDVAPSVLWKRVSASSDLLLRGVTELELLDRLIEEARGSVETT